MRKFIQRISRRQKQCNPTEEPLQRGKTLLLLLVNGSWAQSTRLQSKFPEGNATSDVETLLLLPWGSKRTRHLSAERTCHLRNCSPVRGAREVSREWERVSRVRNEHRDIFVDLSIIRGLECEFWRSAAKGSSKARISALLSQLSDIKKEWRAKLLISS